MAVPAEAPAVVPPPLPEPEPGPQPEIEPVFAAQALPAPEPPRESLGERLREKAGGAEWEAMVGGSWLNKLGVLVLVIGIALLLGYEFARVGPAGRVAIGLGVSLVMLVGGILVDRKPLYQMFARGLIGGGWAALYFTVYAMHAVEAAKVIDDPYLATTLLLAVAPREFARYLFFRLGQELSSFSFEKKVVL